MYEWAGLETPPRGNREERPYPFVTWEIAMRNKTVSGKTRSSKPLAAAAFLVSIVLAGPAAHGAVFVRGDSNMDGTLDISDPIFTLSYLFRGEPAYPKCLEALDANDDESIDIGDAVFTLSYLFAHLSPPPPPFPEAGTDPNGWTFGCEDPSDDRYYYVLTGPEAPPVPPEGFLELAPDLPPPDPETEGEAPSTAQNAEEAILGVLARIEADIEYENEQRNQVEKKASSEPKDPTVVRRALLPLYMRVLRSLLESGELEEAIRSGVSDPPEAPPDPPLVLEPDPDEQCRDLLGPVPECDPRWWYDPLHSTGMCDPLDPDEPPPWEETEPFVPRPFERDGCFPREKDGILSEDIVAEVLDIATLTLQAYENLVDRGDLEDDLPPLEPPAGGGPGDGLHAPVTVNPEFAKEFMERLVPDLPRKLNPVAAYLVEAMRAQENPEKNRTKAGGRGYSKRKVDFAKILREDPWKLRYFNGEETEWANEWAFRSRLPRFWLTEKHDAGAQAEPYFVKLVGMPVRDLSQAGSYGNAYKGGRIMAVSGEVTEEYPLREHEKRGLNPPDNFLAPYSWTAWSLTHGLPATTSAQCWEQDWTRRSDVIEGVRRAAKKAEREVAKKFFDTIMEGFLQELAEQMKEEAEEAFEHYRDEVIKWLRDLMKQKAHAEEAAEYLSELLGVDVSALVAALNFLFDPSAQSAMDFIAEAFGPTILALLAGGPVGVVLNAVLGVLEKAFEHADNFFEFLEGIVGGVLDVVEEVFSFIGDLVKFKEFFRDILAMLNGDDLLGTAPATLFGDTGGIRFPGWKIDRKRYHEDVAEFQGKFSFREHPDKSVVLAQFDIHRLMMYQRGERKYLLAKDVRGISDLHGYIFTVKTRSVVSVGVTRLNKTRPFPGIYLKTSPRGNAYYRCYYSYSRDGYTMVAKIRTRPIRFGTKIYIILKMPKWDEPYAQAGRIFFEAKHMK